MIDNAIHIANQSGFTWYRSDEVSQTGHSFGEKFTNAIADVFAKGHQKIIVLGNDCPALTTALLQKAEIELQQNDWVIGPTSNGGVYLIGIKEHSFNAHSFEKISWQTNIVFQQLTKNIINSGDSYTCFTILDDLNSAADILIIAKKSAANNLILRFLINLFTEGLIKYRFAPCKLIYAAHRSANNHRGPPSENS